MVHFGNQLSRGKVIVGTLDVSYGGAVYPLGYQAAVQAQTRYVGGIASGSPGTGTYQLGDWIVGQDGSFWVCTVAGTPGTWTQAATGLSGAQAITSSSANAFDVGQNGTTNPALQVDASTATSRTGLKIKSAGAAAGLALSVISSGTDENLTVNAKGAGTVTVNGTATGGIVLARQATLSKTLIFTPSAISVLAVDVTAGVVYTKSIAADSSFTASAAGTAGQMIVLIISVDGTQRVATFTTNFNSVGTLTIPASKIGTITFISDGTAWRETARAILS